MTMVFNPDENWWSFSVDPEVRANRSALTGDMEVNPVLPGDRRLLDYHTYLGLDKLLSCQVPCSQIPDERVFVITHQMFELAFKMMIFDLAVIAETMNTLLESSRSSEEMIRLCVHMSDLWLPALTASARLEYAARQVLPMFLGYLGGSEEEDNPETFNSIEFYRFREYLAPASGFQSAQFRLIQRALGKPSLFDVRLFPGDDYWHHYENAAGGPVQVVHPLVLRLDAKIASPESDSPLSPAAKVDDLVHEVLAKLPSLDADEEARSPLSPVPLITQEQLEEVEERLQEILKSHREKQARMGQVPADALQRDELAIETLRSDLQLVREQENVRRQALAPVVSSAAELQRSADGSPLATVIKRLIATDRMLHDPSEPANFLASHLQMAATHISALADYAAEHGHEEPASGTGGGGVPYLGYMRQLLIPLFPALIACRSIFDQPSREEDLL